MMQVGGSSFKPQLVAIPYSLSKIIFTYASMNDAGWPSVNIRVESNSTGQTLLNHMHRGNLYLAQIVSTPALQEAERLLQMKLQNPIEATIGAYFLLKTRNFDRMHTWAKNLANWFEDISDGSIIHAWQLLDQDPSDTDIDEARKRLLGAVDKPLPYFTQGLRLLYDGLTLFDDDSNGKDADIRVALEKIRTYAQSANWSTFTTTYSGAHPREPSNQIEAKDFPDETKYTIEIESLFAGAGAII
jgi:hypothetical protein